MREIITCSQDGTGGWSGKITLSDEERFGIYATEAEALKRAQEQLDAMKTHREEINRKARDYDEQGDCSPLTADDVSQLIDDFTDLVHACRYKQVKFDTQDGFTLDDCMETITYTLGAMGYDEGQIAQHWSGEDS